MIDAMNLKTLRNMRDGLKNGADFALERTRRVEFRRPWVYRKPVAFPRSGRNWLLGILAFSSLTAIVAGVLYTRKRKQIADRFSPGDSDSLNGRRIQDEHLVPAGA